MIQRPSRSTRRQSWCQDIQIQGSQTFCRQVSFDIETDIETEVLDIQASLRNNPYVLHANFRSLTQQVGALDSHIQALPASGSGPALGNNLTLQAKVVLESSD